MSTELNRTTNRKKAGVRKQQAKITKQKIYDAAITLFKQKGFEYVTVDEIVHRAGTAKGTFYNYFQTKGDIILEEFRDIDQFYERNRRRLEKLPTASEQLIEFTRSQCRYIKNRMGVDTLKGLYANQVGFSTTEPFVVDPRRKLSLILSDIIRQGQQSGEFRSDITPEELALWINRSMRGLFFDWAVADGEFNLVTTGVQFFEHFVLTTLYPR